MPYTATYSSENLTRTDVDATIGPLMLEFGTGWCGWCSNAQPHIKTAFAQAGQDVQHLKIEDGPGRQLGRSFRVKLWPTLVFLRDGQEVAKLVRPDSPDEIAQALAWIAG